jgi:hypothetical protein
VGASVGKWDRDKHLLRAWVSIGERPSMGAGWLPGGFALFCFVLLRFLFILLLFFD